MVAYNANTPPEKLAEFASDPSPEVRQFLASNTKCPAEILTRLASDSCPKVRSYVVRHVNTSEGVIVAMSGDADESVQEALAGNSHTPPDVLRKLLALSLQTKRALAGNPSIPEDVARALTESDDEFVLRAIAANSALPVDCARRFLADSRFEVRAAAVTNSAIPVEEIAVLLDDPEVSIRQHLAKRVPHPLLLPRLLADSSADVVEALARNGRLDAATCETLSRHPSAKIRAAIVQNPVTPLENIRALFDCKEEPVVTAIASLHRLPPEAVMEFASRHLDEPKAWYGILHRNVLPESFLERVAAEGPATLKSLLSNQQGLPASVYLALVANGARELWVGLAMHCPEPAVLEKLAEVGDDSIRYWAAKNSKISPARLLKLAHSEPMSGYYETGMRLAAARHPRIAGDALRELFLREVPFFKSQQRQRRRWRRAGKDSDAVMLAFIQRTDLDVQLLEPLLHTHDVEIQRALLSRPDLPDEWRDILLVQALHQCLAGTAPLARCCALMHPRSPAQFFAKTQQSGTWIERWAITQNPAAPAAIIKLLANDSNVIVRNAARRHGK